MPCSIEWIPPYTAFLMPCVACACAMTVLPAARLVHDGRVLVRRKAGGARFVVGRHAPATGVHFDLVGARAQDFARRAADALDTVDDGVWHLRVGWSNVGSAG